MELYHIFDQRGSWFKNAGSFPFVDIESGCRFEPNVPTKAPKTAWLKAQEHIVKPTEDPSEVAEQSAKDEAKAAEAAALAQAQRDKDEATRLAAEEKAAALLQQKEDEKKKAADAVAAAADKSKKA